MKPCSRSLAHRFLFFLCALLLLAIAALFLIERLIVMPALLEEEDQRAGEELARIGQGLEQHRSSLLAQVRDWAHWDDTYEFVQGRHDTYSSANFSREMFEDMHYQLMIFFNADQQVHWVAGIDPETERYTVCARAKDECAWATPAVELLRPLLEDAPGSGLGLSIAYPWPALAAVSPVLRTDRSGPARGWLAKVRLIDTRLTTLLEDQTGLPVSITVQRADEPASGRMTLLRDGDALHANTPLLTHAAGPALQLGTVIPREGFQTAVRIFRYALAWTAVLLLLVIAIVLWLLALLVIRPLRHFTRFARSQHGIRSFLETNKAGEVPRPLLNRRDEFGTLAQHFQSLLDHQHSQSRMLLRLSQHDPLTGLANRRLFDARLDQAMEEAEEHDVSVMMVDIDYFKFYNDLYGHPAGDVCLTRVADAMEETLGHHGFLVARTGGEEFSILLPGTSCCRALEYAETLRLAIEGLALPHAASPVSTVVTVSVGVASIRRVRPRSGTHLMSNADQALYQAKATGRNRVSGHDQSPSLNCE